MLELLVVVVVIGVLVGIAMVRVVDVREKAYIATMQSDVRNYAAAELEYSATNGGYGLPEDLEGSRFSFSPLVSADSADVNNGEGTWYLRVKHSKSSVRCYMDYRDGSGALYRTVRCVDAESGEEVEDENDGEGAVADFTVSAAGANGSVQSSFSPSGVVGDPFETEASSFGGSFSIQAAPDFTFDLGNSLQFDASSSKPSSGAAIIEYRWSVAGEPRGRGLSWVSEFASTGTIPVTLTVEDSNGKTDAVTKQVRMEKDGLVADFAWEPAPAIAGGGVTFTSASTAPSGRTLNYWWTFERDSTGTESGTGESATHVFDEPGIYPVTLLLTDDEGNAAAIKKDVVVKQNASIGSVVAAFNATPTEQSRGLSVVLDASASYSDPSGPLTYHWDLGNGVKMVREAPELEYVYNSKEIYTVKLTVYDADFNSDEAVEEIEVVDKVSTAVLVSRWEPCASATAAADGTQQRWIDVVGGNTAPLFRESGSGTVRTFNFASVWQAGPPAYYQDAGGHYNFAEPGTGVSATSNFSVLVTLNDSMSQTIVLMG